MSVPCGTVHGYAQNLAVASHGDESLQFFGAHSVKVVCPLVRGVSRRCRHRRLRGAPIATLGAAVQLTTGCTQRLFGISCCRMRCGSPAAETFFHGWAPAAESGIKNLGVNRPSISPYR